MDSSPGFNVHNKICYISKEHETTTIESRLDLSLVLAVVDLFVGCNAGGVRL